VSCEVSSAHQHTFQPITGKIVMLHLLQWSSTYFVQNIPDDVKISKKVNRILIEQKKLIKQFCKKSLISAAVVLTH